MVQKPIKNGAILTPKSTPLIPKNDVLTIPAKNNIRFRATGRLRTLASIRQLVFQALNLRRIAPMTRNKLLLTSPWRNRILGNRNFRNIKVNLLTRPKRLVREVEDQAAMDAAMSKLGPAIEDIPNFTNSQPEMLIGEVTA